MQSIIMNQIKGGAPLKSIIRFVIVCAIYGILSTFVLTQLSYKPEFGTIASSIESWSSPEEELINIPSIMFSVNSTRHANETKTDTEAKRSSSNLTQPESVSGNALVKKLEVQTHLLLDVQEQIEELTSKVDRLEEGGGQPASSNIHVRREKHSAAKGENEPIDSDVTGKESSSSVLAVESSLPAELSFSACVQVMDENHRLIEWLAYHYHVMNLRRLIIFPDTHSTQNPGPILDRWKDRINITVWNMTDFFPPGRKLKEDPNQRHRQKQFNFLNKCAGSLHKEGRHWFFTTDPDEFIMINRVRDLKGRVHNFNITNTNFTMPSQEESGSVIKLLERTRHLGENGAGILDGRPCIYMARKMFGNKQANVSFFQDGIPPQIETSKLQTVRYQYRGGLKVGKGMADLSRASKRDLNRETNPHNPLGHGICSREDSRKMWGNEHLSPFVINHYPASWEQLLSRTNDSRGGTNATAYLQKRHRASEKDSKVKEQVAIQDWLKGFIASVGVDEANRLLKDAGQIAEA